jgi:MFS family permease
MCLLFGLLGMSPAGVIMALPGQAVRAENRALGMGVFFTWYFVVTAPAPIIAGWLYDVSGTATWPMYFAVALILATIACNLAFRLAQGGLPEQRPQLSRRHG